MQRLLGYAMLNAIDFKVSLERCIGSLILELNFQNVQFKTLILVYDEATAA